MGASAQEAVVCAQWAATHGGDVKTALLVGDSLPVTGGTPVGLVQADGTGPNVDSVVIPHGRSAYVRSSGITGQGGSTGALYLVTDSGVVFGMHDDETAKHLGLSGTRFRRRGRCGAAARGDRS